MSTLRLAGDPHGWLYVCDLDGTLLRSDGALSEGARNGLSRLLNAGAQVTFATARSLPAVLALMAGVPLRLPVVELNGAFISDPLTGRHLSHRLLAPEIATEAARAVKRQGLDLVLTTWDGISDHVYHGPDLNPGTSWYITEKQAYGDPRLCPHPDPVRVVATERVATVTTFADDGTAPEIAGRLRDALGAEALVTCAPNGYVPGWSEIQAVHPQAHKGTGIEVLRSILGDRVSKVTALGDHLNDLPMFAVADRAVVPANARPEALERAHEVVEANDADGVVHFLLREFAAGGPRADCHRGH